MTRKARRVSKHGFVTSEMRSENMRRVRGSDTRPEIALRKALWHRGFRYRKQNRGIPGKPDIAFRSAKVAVFVDGEFWHGYQWEEKKSRLKSNREYWIEKIEGNMSRDRKVERELKRLGWVVLRFWQHQIAENLDDCVEDVIHAVEESMRTPCTAT